MFGRCCLFWKYQTNVRIFPKHRIPLSRGTKNSLLANRTRNVIMLNCSLADRKCFDLLPVPFDCRQKITREVY